MSNDDPVSSRRNLQPKIDEPIDPKKQAFEGDKYFAERTRSGHLIAHSDVPNNEFMIWQHRAGQFMAFRENGSIQIRANRGMHTFVLGQNHQYISGLESKTIVGQMGLRVKDNSFTTFEKDSTQVTKGDSIVTSKNKAEVVAEQSDIVMGSGTTVAKSGYNIKVTEGSIGLNSTKGASLKSTEESVSISGKKAATIEGGKSIALTAANDLHIRVGNMDIFIDSTGIWINSNQAETAEGKWESTTSTTATKESK
jgi:hypothetical protein